MAKIDALSKYRNQLLSVFNVQQLAEMKRANWSGLLEQTDQLYATMYHDWDVLQKDSNDLAEAVQTLEWTVAPYVADGEEATPEAQEVAKVVTDALWKRTPQGLGSYSHTFTQLIGSLVHGLFRGFNVHEIEWKNDGNMVYPAAFHQLPAQYMRWEDRAGHPDKLLFVADGETAEAKPFPAHKYIVALNTSGPDHPIYNAMYYSLVAWFGAYKFGLGWFMEYCQKYGIPKLVFHYESPSDRKQLEKDLAEERVLNNILLKGDRSVDIANAPASGASLPQRELLNLAESACHKLILGQTLTSDTSDHGGSLAQAKVHAGVQADIVKKRADYVADVLNSQLIPAIVLLNYGKLDVPMPELRFKIPQAGVTLERVQVVKTALEIQGMKLKKSEVYEFTGFAQPAEGDDVFEAAAAGDDAMGGLASLLGATEGKQGDKPSPDDDPDKPKKKAPAHKEEEDAEPVSAANPWGCNQYGHRKGHKGGEKAPEGDGYDFDNMEPDAKLQKAIDELGEVDEEDIDWNDYDEAQKVKKIFHPDNHRVSQKQKERMIYDVGKRVTDALHNMSKTDKESRDWKNPNRPTQEDVQRAEDAFGKAVHEWRRFHRARLEVQGWEKEAIDRWLSRWPEWNENVKSARSDTPEQDEDPAQAWIAPIKKKFLEARKNGASMAELQKMILTLHPRTKALAEAFAKNILAGLKGEEEEAVDAANPYGCNQYGEGWKQPHNGRASKLGKPVKKTDPTDEERKQKEEQQRKEEEERKAREEEEKKDKVKHPIGQATTREEAIQETKSLIDGKGRVKWSEDISIEQINEFNETIAAMKEKYPLETDIVKLGSYISEDDDEGAHCAAWSKPNTDDIVLHLELNQDHEYGGVHDFHNWKPYENWEIKQSGGYKRMNVGVSKSGISIRAVMLHEYGHALHSRAHIAVDYSDKINASWITDNVDVGNKWKEVYATAVNNGDIVKISEYASENDSEFFAECFAARELGEKLPDYINSALDNVINLAIKKT